MEKEINLQVKERDMIVRINKQHGQKYVTIPKHSNVNEGDKIRIIKIVEGDDE